MTDPIRPKERFLVFGAPQIQQEEIEEVQSVLRSGWLGTGPRVHEFENRFKAYKAAPHAVAVNSCTAALHLSLVAAGIGAGDEVVTTPMTFCATVNVILHTGATPVLADCDPKTLNIDPKEIERRITDRTKALLIVHFAGRPCEMDAIVAIAQRHKLILIEDCAHAIETEYHGVRAGTWGDYGCFSFYATKNLTTGEGGMVLCKDPSVESRIRVLSLHGMSKDAWKRFGAEGFKHYDVVAPGFKYNMMDLQAAIGLHQLARIEANWKRREQIWRRYQSELADLSLELPADPDPKTRHAYHLYTPRLLPGRSAVDRDRFLDAMTREGIGVGVHYRSMPEHSYYQNQLGWRPEAFPNAYEVGQTTVSLPLTAKLTDEDVGDVIAATKKALRG